MDQTEETLSHIHPITKRDDAGEHVLAWTVRVTLRRDDKEAINIITLQTHVPTKPLTEWRKSELERFIADNLRGTRAYQDLQRVFLARLAITEHMDFDVNTMSE